MLAGSLRKDQLLATHKSGKLGWILQYCCPLQPLFTTQAHPSPVTLSLRVCMQALCGWLSHPRRAPTIHTRGLQEGNPFSKALRQMIFASVATLPEHRRFPWLSVKMVTAYLFRTTCSTAGIAFGFSPRFSVCRESVPWVLGALKQAAALCSTHLQGTSFRGNPPPSLHADCQDFLP